MFYGEFRNEKRKRRVKKFDLRRQGFEPQIQNKTCILHVYLGKSKKNMSSYFRWMEVWINLKKNNLYDLKIGKDSI